MGYTAREIVVVLTLFIPDLDMLMEDSLLIHTLLERLKYRL